MGETSALHALNSEAIQDVLDRRPEDAIRKLTPVVENGVKDSVVLSMMLNTLGKAYLYEDNFDKAVTCFQGAVKLFPNFGWFHANLGSAYEGLGKEEETSVSYRRAADLGCTSSEFYKSVIEFHEKNHRYGDAAYLSQKQEESSWGIEKLLF